MIPTDNILKVKNRKEIYDLISNNPGIHLRELERKTKLPNGTLRYHLRYMEKKEIILCEKHDGYNRYFIKKQQISKFEKNLLKIMHEEIPRTIFLLIFSFNGLKGLSIKEIEQLAYRMQPGYVKFYTIEKHRTTIKFHIDKLIKQKLIKKINHEKKQKYVIEDIAEVCDFFVKYNQLLPYDIIDFSLFKVNEIDIPEKLVDNILDMLKKVFPHPYFGDNK